MTEFKTTTAALETRPAQSRWSRWRLVALVAALVGVGAVGLATWKAHGPTPRPNFIGPGAMDLAATLPRVEVTRPRRGGIERMTVQPGSVHSFETVELYAMVSGYMKSQGVDIGSPVKKGDLLAEIYIPREAEAVEEAVALVGQARAQALQMEAKVKTMDAERAIAAAAIEQAESDVERFVADRRLGEAQLLRVRALAERNAIERRLVDEQQQAADSSAAAERSSRLAVATARARLLGAVAKVDQAQADVAEACAALRVAEARAAKARVDLSYARIVAPFDGVVIHRGFHPGSFIRSAADGNQTPLLIVSRTDLMRVVVQVPDRDVVLTNAGDPAVVTIDGLGGREFRGTVSRIGESEDPTTRTMRVEVDLANPDDLLRDGMYGRASITLEQPSERLTLPTSCILDRTGKGEGTVQVVRGGVVEPVRVTLGADNGSLVEVNTGIGADDDIVLRSSTPLDPGAKVVMQPAK